MRIALVALPWANYRRPSGALGALVAYLERELPAVEIEDVYGYLTAAQRIGLGTYEMVSEMSYELGELLYCPHLYPETFARVVHAGATMAIEWLSIPGVGEPPTFAAVRVGVSHVITELGEHLDELAEQLSGFDVVGMTTVFGQLFANLSLAKRIRARNPNVKILLGGSTVSAQVGPSLMKEYEFIDFIIQGEGEKPLLALLKALQADRDAQPAVQGLLTRASVLDGAPAALSETNNMDELPYPNYDEYAAVAKQAGIDDWLLPIEGSRGCWWDRTKRSNNPKKTCYFCNLNVQWSGYREKSETRLVEEVDYLVRRYDRDGVMFLDNIVRLKGIERLADGLKQLERPVKFFYEARASLRPYELLQLREAGLYTVQFGIEGLYTPYLRRIGKGTTAIQNLQAMKLCVELDIRNMANILCSFPGATQEEVDATARMIREYACFYMPLTWATFWLGMGSTVDSLRSEFPITNLRNRDFYAVGVPDRVYREVRFFDLSYDSVGATADWAPVTEEMERWRTFWWGYKDKGRLPLSYDEQDGRINIVRHWPSPETVSLDGLEAELFRFCSEIRTRAEIQDEFGAQAGDEAIFATLDDWVGRKIAFQEGGRFLTTVPAASEALARRRIRHLEAQRLARPRPADQAC